MKRLFTRKRIHSSSFLRTTSCREQLQKQQLLTPWTQILKRFHAPATKFSIVLHARILKSGLDHFSNALESSRPLFLFLIQPYLLLDYRLLQPHPTSERFRHESHADFSSILTHWKDRTLFLEKSQRDITMAQ